MSKIEFDWKTHGQLRACATQALADAQLLDWNNAVLAIERQIQKFVESSDSGMLRTTSDDGENNFSSILWYAGIGRVPLHEANDKIRWAKTDWAQRAAREICDSFPPEVPRMQSEFMAEIIRKHVSAGGLIPGCAETLRKR